MRLALAALLAGLVAGTALAKLPPPSPEEKAKLEEKKEEKKAQTEKEKKDLEKAQDRVARQYRGGALPPQAEAQKLKDTDVPKAAKHPDEKPGKPYEGRKGHPQGQAHSSD